MVTTILISAFVRRRPYDAQQKVLGDADTESYPRGTEQATMCCQCRICAREGLADGGCRRSYAALAVILSFCHLRSRVKLALVVVMMMMMMADAPQNGA